MEVEEKMKFVNMWESDLKFEQTKWIKQNWNNPRVSYYFIDTKAKTLFNQNFVDTHESRKFTLACPKDILSYAMCIIH